MAKKIVTRGMLRTVLEGEWRGQDYEIVRLDVPDSMGINWRLRVPSTGDRTTYQSWSFRGYSLTSKDAEPSIECILVELARRRNPSAGALFLKLGQRPLREPDLLDFDEEIVLFDIPLDSLLREADVRAQGQFITEQDFIAAAKSLARVQTGSEIADPLLLAGLGDLLVIADLNAAPADFVAEGMAALDELQRAFGGGGFVIHFSHTGSTAISGVRV